LKVLRKKKKKKTNQIPKTNLQNISLRENLLSKSWVTAGRGAGWLGAHHTHLRLLHHVK